MIEFKKTKNDEYRFIVKSKSGQTLLKSIPFSNETDLKSNLDDFKEKKIAQTKRFERKTNADGKFLIELKNNNGQIIGSSGFYTSEAGMENGILNITSGIESGLLKNK